jgi:hypothetical protein
MTPHLDFFNLCCNFSCVSRLAGAIRNTATVKIGLVESGNETEKYVAGNISVTFALVEDANCHGCCGGNRCRMHAPVTYVQSHIHGNVQVHTNSVSFQSCNAMISRCGHHHLASTTCRPAFFDEQRELTAFPLCSVPILYVILALLFDFTVAGHHCNSLVSSMGQTTDIQLPMYFASLRAIFTTSRSRGPYGGIPYEGGLCCCCCFRYCCCCCSTLYSTSTPAPSCICCCCCCSYCCCIFCSCAVCGF